jgi:hypothetical protein
MEFTWPGVPVTACATPLTFHKAKALKPEGGDMLMQMIGTLAEQEAPASKTATPPAPSRWCREGEATAGYGVYRSNRADAEGYALALGDAGRIVWVQPSLMGQIEKDGRYSVSLADVDGLGAEQLRWRIVHAHSLRELWHLRSEVYSTVAVAHSQFEADSRLQLLNAHFPTRAPRSQFVPL